MIKNSNGLLHFFLFGVLFSIADVDK